MNVIGPGDHGSTFGANPLACAIAVEALGILKDEGLSEKSKELGDYFIKELRNIKSKIIKEVRGRGLFIGVEFVEDINTHKLCEEFLDYGLLCTTARNNVIRLTPPLVITRSEIDYALERIDRVFRRI